MLRNRHLQIDPVPVTLRWNSAGKSWVINGDATGTNAVRDIVHRIQLSLVIERTNCSSPANCLIFFRLGSVNGVNLRLGYSFGYSVTSLSYTKQQLEEPLLCINSNQFQS